MERDPDSAALLMELQSGRESDSPGAKAPGERAQAHSHDTASPDRPPPVPPPAQEVMPSLVNPMLAGLQACGAGDAPNGSWSPSRRSGSPTPPRRTWRIGRTPLPSAAPGLNAAPASVSFVGSQALRVRWDPLRGSPRRSTSPSKGAQWVGLRPRFGRSRPRVEARGAEGGIIVPVRIPEARESR